MWRHTLIPAMVGMAHVSDVKNGLPPMPIHSRNALATPSRKSRIHRNSNPTTTFDISHGERTTVRNNREPDSLSSIQAMAIAHTVWIPMLYATYLSVTQSAF